MRLFEKLARNPFFWAFVVGCVVITSMRPLLRRIPAAPAVIRELPRFQLVDARGKPFGSDDLRGHVYVASFFFTRCQSICPALMRDLARLERRYREDHLDSIRLVTISVDPTHDTPEVLRTAADGYGVDPERWILLTGPLDAIREIAVNGFQVALGEPERTAEGLIDVAHTGKLLLVDAEGRLRGYYDAGDVGLDEVYWRSRHVLEQG
jgi:protein SCO1/2